MDDYLPLLLIIVLSTNAMLFIGQSSITHLSDDMNISQTQFYNLEGTILCDVDQSNCQASTYVLNDTDPTSFLPENAPIESGDGGFFTDMFGSIRNYITDSLGLGYVINILSAPNTFMLMMGLPNEFSYPITALWYLFSLFIFLAFLWGR